MTTSEYNAETGVLKLYSRGQPSEVLATATVVSIHEAHEIMRAAQQLYNEGWRHGWEGAAAATRDALRT